MTICAKIALLKQRFSFIERTSKSELLSFFKQNKTHHLYKSIIYINDYYSYYSCNSWSLK